MLDFLFKRQDPKTELEGLERAQRILDERYEKGQVLPEVYAKQSMQFREKREKLEKKLKKQGKLDY